MNSNYVAEIQATTYKYPERATCIQQHVSVNTSCLSGIHVSGRHIVSWCMRHLTQTRNVINKSSPRVRIPSPQSCYRDTDERTDIRNCWSLYPRPCLSMGGGITIDGRSDDGTASESCPTQILVHTFQHETRQV